MDTGYFGIRLDRIEKAMEDEGFDSKKLAKAVGISEAAISKLLNKKSPGMSAVNLSGIARVLRVSVDYLMGLTDDPLPKSVSQKNRVLELVRLAERLPGSRLLDLILVAQTYVENLEQTQHQLISDMEDLLSRAADEMGHGDELDRRLAERLKEWLAKGNDSDSPRPAGENEDDNATGENNFPQE